LKMGMPKRESRNFSQQWAATLNYTIWPLTVSVVAFLFPGNFVVLADANC
jgi:hypothetical protein